jgi:signal recognition particle GTPase
MSSPLAFKQRVLGADFVPIRGEKFDKLNLIQKGGVLLAVAHRLKIPV